MSWVTLMVNWFRNEQRRESSMPSIRWIWRLDEIEEKVFVGDDGTLEGCDFTYARAELGCGIIQNHQDFLMYSRGGFGRQLHN